MPYSLLTPIVAVLMGITILHDSLNIFKITGSILVILGTAISVLNFRISFKKIKNAYFSS